MTRKEFLNATVALAASAVPVALVSIGAFAATMPEAEGDFTWGGRKAHPAVVNPVMGNEAGSVLSLHGEWEFTPHAGNLGRNGIWKPFYKTKAWPDVRAIQVPACWEAQGVGAPGMGDSWDQKGDHNATRRATTTQSPSATSTWAAAGTARR